VDDLITTPETDTQLYAEVQNVLKSLSKLKILLQTTLALEHLHSLGYIHLNIHSRNVLVAEIHPNCNNNTQYVVKLSDFRFCQKVENENNNMKADDAIKALVIQSQQSPSVRCWLAPEMTNATAATAQLGPWTDVFILGCLFYYVLSGGGEHAFGGENDTDRASTNKCNSAEYKIKNINDNDGASSSTALNNRLINLIECMTSCNPKRRPSTGQIIRYLISNSDGLGPPHENCLRSSSTRSNFFPIYDSDHHRHLRPGLCAIFHQENFNQVRKNYSFYK